MYKFMYLWRHIFYNDANFKKPIRQVIVSNAKENVTLKMTSKYFKLFRDSFNSFNLSNVAEKSGSWLCKDGVTVQVEKRIFTVVCSCFST